MSDSTRTGTADVGALVSAVTRLELPEPSPAETVIALEDLAEDYAAAIHDRLRPLDPPRAATIAEVGRHAERALGQQAIAMQAALLAEEGFDLPGGLAELRRLLGTVPRPERHDETQGYGARLRDRLRRRLPWRHRARQRRAADLRHQRDAIKAQARALLKHEHALLARIRHLDHLYEVTLSHYDDLALGMAALVERQRRLRQDDLPRAEIAETAEATHGQVAALLEADTALERRLRSLQLTRQRVMQGLPAIRLMQEADKRLLSAIWSLLTEALPAWESATEAPRSGPAPSQEDAARQALLARLDDTATLARTRETRRETALAGLPPLLGTPAE